ncbi:MAG: glycosyltransferase [Rhodospirillaceae bacterium]|nr:glycosyltransferase [Rhodospirillaceae bacterium]
MKVLFIGKRFYTNRDALEERYGRIYQLPLHWARQGVEPRLWLIDYHGRRREQRQDETLGVDSTPIRGLAWLFRAAGVVVDRLRGRAPTHIVASGDAYIGLLGWCLARLTGAYFVFDVYDKYDEFGGYRKPLGWNLFGFLLRNADQRWFASRRLLAQLGTEESGDALVMNGIDTNYFRPLDMQESRKRLGLPKSEVLVGYFGSLSFERGVTDLIEAVRHLRDGGVKVKLVLAGKAEAGIHLSSSGLKYLGNLPHSEVPWALSAVDVVAVPYRNSAFLDAASSVKFGEIMACSRPVAATATPNLLDNFPDSARILVARLAEPGDSKDLARAILKQLEEPVHSPLPDKMTSQSIALVALDSLIGLESDAAARGRRK